VGFLISIQEALFRRRFFFKDSKYLEKYPRNLYIGSVLDVSVRRTKRRLDFLLPIFKRTE